MAFLIALSLSSCQFLDEIVPTIIPPDGQDLPTQAPAGADQSPRLRSGQDVPPTWTPPPVVRSETPIAPEEAVPQAGSQGTYTVQSGDTLAEIAQRYNVTLEALALANDIDDYDHIEIGQVLIIPGF
jgi:nucleoid-associated protein YgaU